VEGGNWGQVLFEVRRSELVCYVRPEREVTGGREEFLVHFEECLV